MQRFNRIVVFGVLLTSLLFSSAALGLSAEELVRPSPGYPGVPEVPVAAAEGMPEQRPTFPAKVISCHG